MNLRNNFFLSSILLILFSSFSFASIAADGELTIAYVNIRKILNEAPQQEDISKRLEQDFADEDKKIKDLEKTINDYIQLHPQKSNSAPDNSEDSDNILYKQRELIRLKEKFKDEFNLKRNEEIGKLQALIVKTVADISRERNIDLVLNSDGVIYVSSRVDITPFVLSKLREKIVETK